MSKPDTEGEGIALCTFHEDCATDSLWSFRHFKWSICMCNEVYLGKIVQFGQNSSIWAKEMFLGKLAFMGNRASQSFNKISSSDPKYRFVDTPPPQTRPSTTYVCRKSRRQVGSQVAIFRSQVPISYVTRLFYGSKEQSKSKKMTLFEIGTWDIGTWDSLSRQIAICDLTGPTSQVPISEVPISL